MHQDSNTSTALAVGRANLAKINEVVKASPAIQIQSKISLLQRRAWNVLLANAYNELPNQEIHRVSMVELAAKLGFDSKNEDYLKEVLRQLRACEVEWNLLNKDNKQKWGVAGLLASVEIEDGICTYAFAPHLRLRLYNPRVYAKLNLRLQNRFRSQYALVLWELCFDYFDTERGEGETPFMTLDMFRKLLGIGSDEYLAFSIFNRAVIKPAIKEINKETDYFVEVEQKRIGRRIGELKFRITKVKVLPVQESLFPDIENLPLVAVELVQAGIERPMALKIASQEWDLVSPDKLPPVGAYPDFLGYVSEKIEMSLYAENVKNRGGFIIQAIRENYQDTKVRKAREERAEKVREKALEDLTEEFRVKKGNIIRQAIQMDPELVESAATRITSYFVRERLDGHDTVMEVYQKGGMVKAEIDGILAAEFCHELLAPVIAAYEDERDRLLEAEG
ncbi:RepB family plasmid replication initiator protein [Candidatus Poribacteria bacterium]|nr:RepB family plasmid replication initiator protein [Candidatus Poribacteria bacterium]